MFFLLFLPSFLCQVSDHISANLSIHAERAEQVLKDQEIMWKAANKDLLKRVELLSKEKAQKEEEHEAEMTKVIVEVKAIAILVVWEAHIKLVEYVANARSWNLAGQQAGLAKLKGEPINTS